MDYPQQGTPGTSAAPPAPTEWPTPQGAALRELASIGTVLSHAFSMPWRKASVLFVWAVLVPAAAIFVPYEVMTAATVGMTDSAEFGSRENPFANLGLGLVALIAGLIYMFASLAATAFVTVFVVEHIRARFLGYQPSARDTWAMIRRVVWRFLGYTVLLTIALVFGILILAIFGGAAIGIAATAAPGSSAGPTVILFATIIVLALTALIIWPLVKLSYVPTIMVFEGSSATAAMSRSWRLTKGRGWRTFGTLFIVSISFTMVSGAITLLAEGVSSGFLANPSVDTLDTFASTTTFSVATVLADVITFPLTMLSTAAIAIAATLIYLDARTQAERLDMTVEHWLGGISQGYQPQQLAYPFATPVAAPPMAAPPVPPAASQAAPFAPPAAPFAPPTPPFAPQVPPFAPQVPPSAPPAAGQQGEAPDAQDQTPGPQGETPDPQTPFPGQP